MATVVLRARADGRQRLRDVTPLAQRIRVNRRATVNVVVALENEAQVLVSPPR